MKGEVPKTPREPSLRDYCILITHLAGTSGLPVDTGESKLRVRLKTSHFSVASWQCQHPLRAIGAEECASHHEIVLQRSGSYVRHRTDRDVTVADPTVMLLTNPGETFRVSHPDSNGDRCTVFFLRPELVAQMLGEPSFPVSALHVSAETYAQHLYLMSWLEGGAEDQLAIEEATLNLLLRIAMEVAEAGGVSKPAVASAKFHRDVAQGLKVLLATRFRERLTLGEMAASAGLSPYYTSRVFHATAGVPLHRYLVRLRLRAALEQLAQGESNLARLALDLGFSSHSHFTNAFRAEFGCSPSTWRRRVSRQSTISRNSQGD